MDDTVTTESVDPGSPVQDDDTINTPITENLPLVDSQLAKDADESIPPAMDESFAIVTDRVEDDEYDIVSPEEAPIELAEEYPAVTVCPV